MILFEVALNLFIEYGVPRQTRRDRELLLIAAQKEPDALRVALNWPLDSYDLGLTTR